MTTLAVLMMYLKLVVVLLFIISFKLSYSIKTVDRYIIKQKLENGKLIHYAYLKNSDFWAASAYYDEYYNTTGWDVFETETNPLVADELQAYGAGLLEGSMTWKAIYKHYFNNFYTYCKDREEICIKVNEFLKINSKFVRKMIKKHGENSSIWHQVKLIYKQIKGIYHGYKKSCNNIGMRLRYKDILRINLQMDLNDVAEAFSGNEIPAKVRGDSHCSAIIKLLSNYSDILIGHNTWSGYNSMIRILKRYNHNYRTNSEGTSFVPAVSMAFSGYPGVISSGDDFYIMSSKLLAVETTIGNSNISLWNKVKPKDMHCFAVGNCYAVKQCCSNNKEEEEENKQTRNVFEAIRSVACNRLAKDGQSWGAYFTLFNSGTYNNQWMIVDLNKFTPGSEPVAGLLHVLEQIPGYIRIDDQTKLFVNQTYWPSYNIPFNKDVFNMSGNQQLVKQFGDWFTYDKNPRALIFKRDHTEVTDLYTLLDLLRSNDYKRDYYGKCKCKPPYSAENALAARSDLNPVDGIYPFPALGHRPHGAIDAKVTSYKWVLTSQFEAVCGPTTGSKLPMFKWSKSDFKDKVLHFGQPDSFDFKPFLIKWYYNTKN